MISIKRKEDCCGCGACYDACNHHAIEWKADEEGFFYPSVNQSVCINCGLCELVCPICNSDMINQTNEKPPILKGGYHLNDDVRFTSTSGGAFWGLAENWIKNGGYVTGAVFSDHFQVRHIVTNSIEGLNLIKGSKYTQGNCIGLYKEIATLLKKGEHVMATGLPCQMAALKQFLRKPYDNLLLVNVICHSVSSPLAFQKYIEFLENKYKSKMIYYHPKNKEYGGWHNFAFKAVFENGEKYVAHLADDYYTQIFVGHSHLLTRPSCFECHFKHFPQPTDITIGDFWGVENIDTEMDSPKGVSIFMLNSEKGKRYFEDLNCFYLKDYNVDVAVFQNKRNQSIRKCVSRPDEKKRLRCIHDLNILEFSKFANKYFMPRSSLKGFINKLLHK